MKKFLLTMLAAIMLVTLMSGCKTNFKNTNVEVDGDSTYVSVDSVDVAVDSVAVADSVVAE